MSGLFKSRTTQNSMAAGLVLAFIVWLRAHWTGVWWNPEADEAIVAGLMALFGPLLARKLAFFRNPEKVAVRDWPGLLPDEALKRAVMVLSGNRWIPYAGDSMLDALTGGYPAVKCEDGRVYDVKFGGWRTWETDFAAIDKLGELVK